MTKSRASPKTEPQSPAPGLGEGLLETSLHQTMQQARHGVQCSGGGTAELPAFLLCLQLEPGQKSREPKSLSDQAGSLEDTMDQDKKEDRLGWAGSLEPLWLGAAGHSQGHLSARSVAFGHSHLYLPQFRKP